MLDTPGWVKIAVSASSPAALPEPLDSTAAQNLRHAPTPTCAAGCASRRIFCPYLSTSSLQRGSSALSCCSGSLSSRSVLRATGAWLRGSGDADAAQACTPGRVSCSKTSTSPSHTLQAQAFACYPPTHSLRLCLPSSSQAFVTSMDHLCVPQQCWAAAGHQVALYHNHGRLWQSWCIEHAVPCAGETNCSQGTILALSETSDVRTAPVCA